jgi:hypothetical protein
MTSWTRLLRTFAAAALTACLVLSGGSGNIALANGVGDLYVADPSGVRELYLKTQTTESLITVPEIPTKLAFTPDGQTLYAAGGTTDLYQVDIATLNVSGPTSAKGPIVALAHPEGSALYMAFDGSKTLGVLMDQAATVLDGATLTAAPDLLAADALDPRLVAGSTSGTWVSIFEPASGKVIQVGGTSGIGATVVAMSVARASGYVWVATKNQNRVFLISLSNGRVVSSVPISAGVPTAITALDDYAVVAVGSKLYKVVAKSVTPWATAAGPVVALSSDLTASFVYAATADSVTALDVTDPTAAPAAAVGLPKGAPTALAPVPNRGSSLANTSGTPTGAVPSIAGTSGRGSGGTDAAGTSRPGRTQAPTDTVSGLVPGGPGMDAAAVLLGLGVLILATTLGSRYLIRRLVGE